MTTPRFSTTRTLLAALLATTSITVGTIASSSPAAAEDKVTFRLNWLLYGFHTPFYLGLERGYYKAEGIDLTIGEGQGSVRTVQVVGAKGDTFGLSDAGSVIAGASKGAPVKTVMAVSNKSPYALAVRADSGVKTVKDLEGKTIAGAAGEAGLQLFPAIVKFNKLDESKIKFVKLEGAGKMVAIMENKADAILAGLDNQSIVLAQKGLKIINFPYTEIGVNTVGLTIHANVETIEKNPDLVRRFVKATIRSLDAAVAEPEASIAAGMKVKSDMEKDLSLEQLKVGISLMKSATAPDKPTGYSNLKDWEDTLALMKEYQELTTDKTAQAFFTNDFLPK